MKPICVDLDNTLIFADTMFLLWLQVLKKNPLLAIYAGFIFLFTGSAQAKHFLTCHANLDIEHLPFNKKLIQWLEKQKQYGHPIWLVTGSNQFIANRIALHLSIFDGVLASDKQNNLVGPKKASTLKSHFSSFIYIGDHKQDIAVWDVADESGIVCVNKIPPFNRTFKYIFDRPKAITKDWIKLLRIDHWSKNLLIWLPILLHYPLLNSENILNAFTAMFCLCIFASIGYIFNDAIDLNDDFSSKRNQNRPFVKGTIDILKSFKISLIMLIFNIFIMFFIPLETQFFLISYLIISLFYTLIAKHIAVLDIFILASLYALRVEIGCSLVKNSCSPELSLAILFICFGLACAKRFSDIKQKDIHAKDHVYKASDIHLIAMFGISTSCIGAMLSSDFLRHFTNNINHFEQPNYLFLSIPLLVYWQFKVWYCAYHNSPLNKPVNFLKSQPDTYIIFALLSLILYFAL